MYRFFLFLIPFFLYGNEFIKIVANNLTNKQGIIVAKGDVLVTSPKFYATSDKIIYDKNNSTVELIGSVNIYSNKNLIFLGEYSFLDLKKRFKKIYPVLTIDRKSKLWLSGKDSKDINDTIYINNATISSCECYDPAWRIDFKEGVFNRKTKLFESYYNHLYIREFPFYYFLFPLLFIVEPVHVGAIFLLTNPPYFRASFDKTRRSGLLRPTFGYGKENGYFIYQPIYFAPRPNYDIELIPQVRSRRGGGYEIKYRIATNKDAKLEVSGGEFYEKDSFLKKYHLLHKEHFGWDLKYKKRNLFKNDEIYIYAQNMNDIEYKNTRYKATQTSSNLLESKIQYYRNFKKSYLGIRTSYFNNLLAKNNDNTLQILPEIKTHRFLDKFYKLTYNIDLHYQRYYRRVGVAGEKYDLILPISYDRDFLDDYFHLKLSEVGYLTKIDYKNEDYENAIYGKNKHIISLSTNLFKRFDSITHNIKFKTEYIYINKIKEKGDIYGINSNENNISFFGLNKDSNSLSFNFNQFFYYKGSKLLYHSIRQGILYPKNGKKIKSNLENSIKIFFKNGKISNSFLYNHKDKMVISKVSNLTFDNKEIFANIDHRWIKDTAKVADKNNFSYKNLPSLESITYSIGSRLDKNYKISYKEQQDLKQHISFYKEYLLDIDKKCWSLNLKLRDSLIATSSVDNKARRQNIYYITLTLKPIGSIKHMYIQKER